MNKVCVNHPYIIAPQNLYAIATKWNLYKCVFIVNESLTYNRLH